MENKVFVIRKAMEKDVSVIQKITKESFEVYVQNAGIPGTTAALEESFEDIINDINTKECFVAEYNNIIVGSVRIEVREDKTAYLSRFSVASEYQSNGVGGKLISAVDEAMKNLEVKKLYLHTASKLPYLVKFYYSRGFYIDSTSKDKGYVRALFCKEYV